MIYPDRINEIVRLAEEEERRIEAALGNMSYGRAIQICKYLWALDLARAGLPIERPDMEDEAPYPTERMLRAAWEAWLDAGGETRGARFAKAIQAALLAVEPKPRPSDEKMPGKQDVLQWAVSRWHAEVAQRPLINHHRRTLDDTWRQVIRYCGGDPEALLGPAHDALLASDAGAAAAPQSPEAREPSERAVWEARRARAVLGTTPEAQPQEPSPEEIGAILTKYGEVVKHELTGRFVFITRDVLSMTAAMRAVRAWPGKNESSEK